MFAQMFAARSLRDNILALPGCVALWPCDERSGTLKDMVGGGGLGTVAGGATFGGPTVVPADGGSSIAFYGATGEQVTGTGTNLPVGTNTTDWTILGWAYFAAAPAAGTGLFGYGGTRTGSSKKMRYAIRFNSHVYMWGDSADKDSAVDYSIGRPQLIAASNANGTITTSKDGVLVVSGAPTNALVTPDTQAWVMGRTALSVASITGRLSHYAIFNRALSLNELRNLANVAAGN